METRMLLMWLCNWSKPNKKLNCLNKKVEGLWGKGIITIILNSSSLSSKDSKK